MIFISHLLPDHEMAELLRETGSGIESIEFSIADHLDSLQEHIASYRKRLRKIGCRRLILHGPFLDLNPMTYDREIRRATFLRYRQAYRAATELGAEKIVFHTGYYPDVYFLINWPERMADFYRRFLEECPGARVVMENVFDREWAPLIKTAELVGDDRFRLCLDVGHAHCYSPIPVTDWAENLAPYVSHIHIHDNNRRSDQHDAVGNGTVPWEQLFPMFAGREDVSWTIECSTKKAVLQSYRALRRAGIRP